MNTETKAPVVATLPHQATFHFKSWANGSKQAEELLTAVKAGKLEEKQIGVETVEKDGKEVEMLKRNAEKVSMVLPRVEVEGFTPEQNSYLQALVAQHLEAKQKVLVDAYSTDVVQWDKTFSQPFTVKRSVIKVSAEENKAAIEVLKTVLAELTKPQGVDTIAALAEKKFSAAACGAIRKIEVLERINDLILEAFELLQEQDAELAAAHSPAFTLWLESIEKFMQPDDLANADMDMF